MITEDILLLRKGTSNRSKKSNQRWHMVLAAQMDRAVGVCWGERPSDLCTASGDMHGSAGLQMFYLAPVCGRRDLPQARSRALPVGVLPAPNGCLRLTTGGASEIIFC